MSQHSHAILKLLIHLSIYSINGKLICYAEKASEKLRRAMVSLVLIAKWNITQFLIYLSKTNASTLPLQQSKENLEIEVHYSIKLHSTYQSTTAPGRMHPLITLIGHFRI